MDTDASHFKYHLNHLRPPSLVPITIVQQAVQAPNADQTMAASTNADWSAAAAPGSAAWSEDQLVGQTRLAQFQNLSNLVEAGEPERLVQLQLPLQLHLKLRPLPLPMPPPSERAAPPPDVLETKRKRSLEQAGGPTQPPLQPSPASPSSSSSSSSRGDLMALTWREAKRILLLSSMSPALVQAKLERRFAELPEQQPEQQPEQKVNSSPGPDSLTKSAEQVGEQRTPLERRRASPMAEAGEPTSSEWSAGQQQVAALAKLQSAGEPARLDSSAEVRRQRHSSQQVSKTVAIFSFSLSNLAPGRVRLRFQGAL